MDDLVRYRYLESEPLRLLSANGIRSERQESFACFIKDRKLVGTSQYHYAVTMKRRARTNGLHSRTSSPALPEIKEAIRGVSSLPRLFLIFTLTTLVWICGGITPGRSR